MSPFKHNKIFLDSETLSEQLRTARQEKNLKVEKIAEKLNISPKYIEALEKGDFEKLPKGVYGKNFLREYALFLGLNYHNLKKIFEKEAETADESDTQKLFSRQIAKARYFLAIPKIIRNFAIFTVVVICFSYLGYAIKKIYLPPSLLVENPIENLTIKEKTINVAGKTETESQVTINGEAVLSDGAGRFNEEINLKEGLNTITITARKKYGKENTITRQILVEEG